jgi:hypothetical protein
VARKAENAGFGDYVDVVVHIFLRDAHLLWTDLWGFHPQYLRERSLTERRGNNEKPKKDTRAAPQRSFNFY